MSVLKVTGPGGETISLLELDGEFFPPDLDVQVIKDLKAFSFRHDDVIICSYPKTGE